MKDESGSSESVALAVVAVAFVIAIFVYTLAIVVKLLLWTLLFAAIGAAVYFLIKQLNQDIDPEPRKVLAQVNEQKPIEGGPGLGTKSVRWQEKASPETMRQVRERMQRQLPPELEASQLERHKVEALRKAEENEMKTPEELFKEFEETATMTTIQKEEHLKKLIGIKVRVLGEIRNIETTYISLQNITPALSRDNSIHINYKGDQLRQQLLKYSRGDGVELTTRLTGASLESSVYFLDLLSIRKPNTNGERWIAPSEK